MENFTGDTGGDSSAGKYASFAEAFNSDIIDSVDNIRPGKIVTGQVVQIDKDFVQVDVNYKSIGVIPKEQFYDINDELTVKVGDDVEVYIVALENEQNQIVLSYERALQLKVWKEVEEKFEGGGIVTGKVQHKVKGGLQVDIGIPAFLPGSQVDIKPHKNLDRFIGEVYDFKVLKITKEKGNIVVSRRALLLTEREELRSETLKAIGEGVVLEGSVKNITDYGAFIDLGGIDGLLHITDITWGHIEHPADRLSVGQKVAVVVVSYDEEKERVSLGMKQLTDDPWEKVQGRFTEGQHVNGKVVGSGEFGLHVELEEGIEGYVHVNDLSWTKKVRHPGKTYPKGKEVEAIVLSVDADERKINLSFKHLEANPWDTLGERIPIGTKVTGKVRSMTDFGVFVGIEDGIDGLVHMSDISWTEKFGSMADLKQKFKRGDEIEAIVLDITPSEERLSLSIKQLGEDPWPEIIQRYPVGTKVKGQVSAIADFGVFVQLEENVQGMVHNSELGVGKKTPTEEAFKVGSEVECLVINVDSDSSDRRIGLSIKAAKQASRDAALANFNDDSVNSKLGDIFKEKLGIE